MLFTKWILSDQVKNNIGGTLQHTREKWEIHMKFWFESLKKGDHFVGICVDGRIMLCQIWVWGCELHLVGPGLGPESTNVSKCSEPLPNFRYQKDGIKQVPRYKPTVLKWPMNLTVIWCCLYGTCELIHIFMCREKASIIVLKILSATVQNK